MQPRLERRLGEREVRVVRGRDHDAVDEAGGEELVRVVEHVLDVERLAREVEPLWIVVCDGDKRRAVVGQQARNVVLRPPPAGADDADARRRAHQREQPRAGAAEDVRALGFAEVGERVVDEPEQPPVAGILRRPGVVGRPQHPRCAVRLVDHSCVLDQIRVGIDEPG